MPDRKVCVTGAGGFIGMHIVELMGRQEGVTVVPLDHEAFNDNTRLVPALKGADAVVHLAAKNRGDDVYESNIQIVKTLISALDESGSTPHVLFSSSTQSGLDNPYGRSKKAGEELLAKWAEAAGGSVTNMVIPNVYGPGCKPFYNSVVATFCHQLTHGETPHVEVDKEMELIYVSELVEAISGFINNAPSSGVRVEQVKGTAKSTVSGLLEVLQSFREHYFNLHVVPELKDQFHADLYRTFITYMDDDDLAQRPTIHEDERGNLFEVVKQISGQVQVFVSSTKPGVVRGNHYHTRKLEKFCVLEGSGVIRLRSIGSDDVREIRIEDPPVFVEIPVFYTHNIENTGSADMLTLFWAGELFDPDDSDTYYMDV